LKFNLETGRGEIIRLSAVRLPGAGIEISSPIGRSRVAEA
jgi:hypothetical protein